MSKYSNLNKEIREQVDNCLLQNATSNINPHLRNLFICTGAGYNYNKNEEYQKYLFSYLTSKELETVVNICKAGMNVEDTYDKLYKFANEKFNNPDYSVISFNHTFTNPYYKSSNVNDAISLCCNIIKCLFNIKEINGRKALVKLGVLEDSKLTDDVINHVSEPAVLTSKDIEHLLTLKYYYY
jgi:hypothetical protein